MSQIFEVKGSKLLSGSVEAAKADLTNLVTTSIPVNLVPDTDGALNLGSGSLRWNDVHANKIVNVPGQLELEAQGGALNLKAQDGNPVSLLSLGASNAPALRFYNAAGTFYAAVKAPALSANYTLTLPTDDGASGQVLSTDGSGVLSWVSMSGASWTKYTVSHTSLQAAALTNNIELFSLAAKGVIRGIIIKHTTAFAGTGITGYTVSVGIASALQKYSTAFDVFQAVGPGVGQASNVVDFESFTSATSIRIAATSVGANLDQSTAGSVDVYVLSETLP